MSLKIFNEKTAKTNKQEINLEDKNKNLNSNNPVVWDNPDVKIISCVETIITQPIKNIMYKLDKIFTDVEFSIFCNHHVKNNFLYIGPKFFIPKQKVSRVAIDYIDDAPENFNVVIHKHPSGCKEFSETDKKYINRNFDISILYLDSCFSSGKYRLNTEFGFSHLNLKIVTEIHDIRLSIEEINKIEKMVYVPAVNQQPNGNCLLKNKNENFINGAKGYILEDDDDYYSEFEKMWGNLGYDFNDI
jgi:hypothetical protein